MKEDGLAVDLQNDKDTFVAQDFSTQRACVEGDAKITPHSKLVKEVEATEASDWSDWEDADKTDNNNIISDEIEAELRNMSSPSYSTSSVSVGDNEGKVPTSPSPYRNRSSLSPSPESLTGWSEMPEADQTANSFIHGVSATSPGAHIKDDRDSRSTFKHGGHAMDLRNDNKKSSYRMGTHPEKGTNVNFNSTLSSSSSSSFTGKTSTGSSLKLKSTSSSQSRSTQKVTAAKKKNVDDFGFGYDIKSIEIKSSPASALSDFFADMTPEISTSSKSDMNSLLSIDSHNGEDAQKASKPDRQSREKSQSSLFAVNAVASMVSSLLIPSQTYLFKLRYLIGLVSN